MTLCACGCGNEVRTASRGRRYVHGHTNAIYRAHDLKKHGIYNEFGCLIWQGSISGRYGSVSINNKKRYVHRLVLENRLGRGLRKGERACHTCDTPLCFEDSHIFLGTPATNSADMVSKQRQAHGERNGRRKLTTKQVDALRFLREGGTSYGMLATLFGISATQARRISLGERWRLT